MDNLKQDNQDYSNDIIYHLEQLKTDLYRTQISNNRNYILSKSIEVIIQKIEILIRLAQDNVRFSWLMIQNEMDRSFKEDNSLTGFNILFDFVETEKPNRAMIKLTKYKEDEKGK